MKFTLNEDAEEASFSLNDMLASFDENTSAYAHMPTRNPYSHFCFALNIEMSAEELIQALKVYLADLERGICREVLCIEKKMMRKEYWEKGGLLRRNLQAVRGRLEQEKMINAILKVQNGATYENFIACVDHSYEEVARLLSEIRQKVMKMPRQMYGQFYMYERSKHDPQPVTMAYDEWKMQESDDSFRTLKGKQTQVVVEFLRKDLLRLLRTPTQSEIDDVEADKVICWMPCDYDREYLMSDEFRIQCAKFRRFCSWDGDILKLNYDCLGKYLFQNYYKMTAEERHAFFELDLMQEMINKDMNKVMQKAQETAMNHNEEVMKRAMDRATVMQQKIKDCIFAMTGEGTLQHLYDFTWLMAVMNQSDNLPCFDTPGSFVNYLRSLGVMKLPTESSINKAQNKFFGTFPDWEFTDCDQTEADRRINVGKRFLSLYRKSQ